MTSARHIKDGALHLTKLMDWYKDDFVKEGFHQSARALCGAVHRRRDQEIHPEQGRQAQGEGVYNWNLNSKANMAN